MCPAEPAAVVRPCPWCGAPHSSADHDPGWHFMPACCQHTLLVWRHVPDGLVLEWVPGEDDERARPAEAV